MTQSTLLSEPKGLLHVAVIMDGNGRWATRRGWPRAAGHRAGAGAARRAVESAVELGVGTLTLFAFSADNWSRPASEVETLMDLIGEFLRRETARLVANGVRLQVIGRRDRLGSALRRAIREAERCSASGTRLQLRIALDYSGREAIARAARRFARAAEPSLECFGQLLAAPCRNGPPIPQVDLLIRTGGERRLSDFLLWESAYAELYFTDRMWPDFDRGDLREALRDFARRERRFGSLPPALPRAAACYPTTSAGWLAHFRQNRASLLPIPWHLVDEIDADERRAIARSIRAFQLGESSDGAHLLRYARLDAERSGDRLHAEVTRLFIAEEQRHAADLGRFMKQNGIALARRNWTDAVFRRLRTLLRTLEGAIGVLVTAEILAKVYYRALRRATGSRVLRRVCAQILRDERAHVTFQTQQLARLRRGRRPALLAWTHALQCLLFLAATLVVWCSHAATLRRGGYTFRRYAGACWREFRSDLSAMDPRRTAPHEAAPHPSSTIAWPAPL